MVERDQLFFKDVKGVFRRLPEGEVITPLADEMSKTTEARIAIEGISQFKERHLAFGDTQYPDVDEKALNSVLLMNQDFKATHVWLMGDMLNVTTLSKFGFPAGYRITLGEEVKIHYLEGNHELRLKKFMDRNASLLDDLDEPNGEKTIDLPRLLNLRELGIKWTPYWEDEKAGDTTVLHGNLARVKGGYTAQAYIDRYGESVMAGHSHRLALIERTQSGKVKFGIETGSLCKRDMVVPYVKSGQADWQQGCAIIGIDKQNTAFPAILPIIDGKVALGNKVYNG